jgi:hypothetical protein
VVAWGTLDADVRFQLDRGKPSVPAAGTRGPVVNILNKGRSDGGRLSIRRDDSRDLLFVETADAAPGRHGAWDTSRIAFRNSTLQKIDVAPLHLRRECGPPTAWLASAIVGMALAAISVGWRSRSMRRISDRHAWRPGCCNKVGVLTLEDGTTLPRPQGIDLAEGPVVVILKPGIGTAPYRGGSDAVDIAVPGTVGRLEDAIEHALAIRWSFALVALVLSSTPLVVAATLGFLW